MELKVDDRESHVIKFLREFKDLNIKVERITVGDYAIIYKGRIIAVIERKSLADLAASIKDGRMDNNAKLLSAQAQTGCRVIYLIEGAAFPKLTRKFGRIPFKALQGKIDGLQFRHNIRVIYTRDCDHTASRLRGLCTTFERYAKEGLFGEFKDVTAGNSLPNSILKANHVVALDSLHITMSTKIKGMTRGKAGSIFQHYNIRELLTGQTDEKTLYNMVYPNGKMKFGPRGAALHKHLKSLTDKEKCGVLSTINGITMSTAERILAEVKFEDIVGNVFAPGAIADIKKTETRRIGKAVELRIRLAFAEPETETEKTDTEKKI